MRALCNFVKWVVRLPISLAMYTLLLVAKLIFVGCVVTWVVPGTPISQIIFAVGGPIRPILPFGGLLYAGSTGWIIDFAPIPISIVMHAVASVLGSIRDSRILAPSRKPTS